MVRIVEALEATTVALAATQEASTVVEVGSMVDTEVA